MVERIPGETATWLDRFAWLLLIRTFRLATATRLLLLGALLLLLTSAGWRVAYRVFPPSDNVATTAQLYPQLACWPYTRPAISFAALSRFTKATETSDSAFAQHAPAPLTTMPVRLVVPFMELFRQSHTWNDWLFFFLGGLWTLAVTAWIGGAITRIAVVYLGREEQFGLGQALRHATRKWRSQLEAVLLPIMAMLLLSLPLAGLGWLMRWPTGMLLAGVVWLPVLAIGFVLVILAVGLLFGWPTLWGALASEAADAFDAISRCYAYTFQRPLEYGFFAVVAGLFGTLGWLVVWIGSEAIIELGYWGVGWGAGAARIEAIATDVDGLLRMPDQLSAEARVASDIAPAPAGEPARFALPHLLIALAVGVIRSLASGFAVSYFWCAAAGIYLLLRLHVDKTELDEIHFEQESSASYGLPPLDDVPDTAEGSSDGPQPAQQD